MPFTTWEAEAGEGTSYGLSAPYTFGYVSILLKCKFLFQKAVTSLR